MTQLHTISLGAGVQSSVLALLASRGDLTPRPDCAIFADTGWEPQAVYDHLDWLETQLTFPVHRVSGGNLRSDFLNGVRPDGTPHTTIPVFIRNLEGGKGMGRRQCTRYYKINPIQQEIRRLLGLQPRQKAPKSTKALTWVGLSLDEIYRMKPSGVPWIANEWPLIDRRMTRHDCQLWFAHHYPGRSLPRSACIGCPYHSDAEWLNMKTRDPDSWADAVYVDRTARASAQRGLDGKIYLHPSLKPLDEVKLDKNEGQFSLWGEECDGMCGL